MAQRVEGNVEIAAPVEDVYGYWETLENLPRFMSNVDEVRSTGPDTTHWKIRGPLGAKVEFDARTTEKKENEALGWNSTDGDVGTSGEVRFEQITPSRTRVEVQMNYSNPPGGKVGEAASKAVANPKVMLEQDLHNLKDILEGKATPEEVQSRPSAASAQSGLAAFLTSGAGLALLGGGILLYLLLRNGGGSSHSFTGGKKGNVRFIIEI
ncbi:MAG: SRPBCC family protein [Actinomycetota bacterium]|jgi:uncharacterized membrane protein|nr:SRPBCC family protein [Rubrobacter sp.]MDQ3506600.1 SRPBCC family protein [Actinomycetota bacterium]